MKGCTSKAKRIAQFRSWKRTASSASGPLHYSFDLGLSEGALWANGSLTQTVELTCVSCLERFKYTIRVPQFALHTELGGPELIDLTPFVREDILLEFAGLPALRSRRRQSLSRAAPRRRI